MGLACILLYQVIIFILSSVMSSHGIIADDPRFTTVLFFEMHKLMHAKANIVIDLHACSIIVNFNVN